MNVEYSALEAIAFKPSITIQFSLKNLYEVFWKDISNLIF